MQTSFKILLADEQVIFRRGVRSLIQEMQNVEVVGEAGEGFELLRLVRDIHPHLVIMDISLPNLRGLEAIREIKIANPGGKVLILIMHKDQKYLYHALTAGAEGYLLKKDGDGEWIAAIDTLRKGGIFISPLLSAQMAAIFPNGFQVGSKPLIAPEERLTVRERQVVKLVAEGKSSKEIGELLFISYWTVQRHRANIKKKLNFKNTAELVKYAIQKNSVTGAAS